LRNIYLKKIEPSAKTGKSFAILETYKTPEYLQVKLNRSLVVGKKYIVSMWVTRSYEMMANYDAHNSMLSTAFSKNHVYHKNYLPLQIKPVADFRFKNDLKKAKEWQNYSAVFTADDTYSFLILGTFRELPKITDRECRLSEYYYIDEISLYELENDKNYTIFSTNLFYKHFKSGKIQFDINTESKEQLTEITKLILALKSDYEVFVEGHSDSQGIESENVVLSQKRAVFIKNELTKLGISSDFIRTKGYGSSTPIGNNSTEEGRALNRRVTIKVLKKVK
jgi:hypothetical protein